MEVSSFRNTHALPEPGAHGVASGTNARTCGKHSAKLKAETHSQPGTVADVRDQRLTSLADFHSHQQLCTLNASFNKLSSIDAWRPNCLKNLQLASNSLNSLGRINLFTDLEVCFVVSSSWWYDGICKRCVICTACIQFCTFAAAF